MPRKGLASGLDRRRTPKLARVLLMAGDAFLVAVRGEPRIYNNMRDVVASPAL